MPKKNFVPKFFFPKYFLVKKIFGTKNLGTKFFGGRNFFWLKIFLGQHFFSTIFFCQKNFLTKKNFSQKFFAKKYFWDKYFSSLYGSNLTPKWVTQQFNLICINWKVYWLPIRSSIDATSIHLHKKCYTQKKICWLPIRSSIGATSIPSIKSDTPKKIGSLVASKKLPRVLLGPPLYLNGSPIVLVCYYRNSSVCKNDTFE